MTWGAINNVVGQNLGYSPANIEYINSLNITSPVAVAESQPYPNTKDKKRKSTLAYTNTRNLAKQIQDTRDMSKTMTGKAMKANQAAKPANSATAARKSSKITKGKAATTKASKSTSKTATAPKPTANTSKKRKAEAPAAAAGSATKKARVIKKAVAPSKKTSVTSKGKGKAKVAIDTEDEEDEEAKVTEPPSKKARVAAPKKVKKGAIINEAPKRKYDVYVFGEGSSSELGLGTARNAIDVKRPRLNPHLARATVGVVQIATGGMHVVALTHDNKILTWGVNDQGALGRDTTWDGGLRDIDAEDSDDEEEENNGLNPNECIPTAIPADSFPEGTVFTHVAAADSASFAVTDEGKVYGWGTFRVSTSPEARSTTRLLLSRLPPLDDNTDTPLRATKESSASLSIPTSRIPQS